ncbi:dispanin subfamily A member 2b-like [Erpetoichthys calabaricus]|nr:dispanin subfamily A member 2b-like [Erpetoichthys calabaricus]
MEASVGHPQKDVNAPPYYPATVVQVEQDPTSVKDHVLWSLFSFGYLNCCCLGLVALWYSIKSRDQKLAKNLTLASGYGASAKRFNIAATVLSVIVFIIVIAIYATTIAAAISQMKGPH